MLLSNVFYLSNIFMLLSNVFYLSSILMLPSNVLISVVQGVRGIGLPASIPGQYRQHPRDEGLGPPLHHEHLPPKQLKE